MTPCRRVTWQTTSHDEIGYVEGRNLAMEFRLRVRFSQQCLKIDNKRLFEQHVCQVHVSLAAFNRHLQLYSAVIGAPVVDRISWNRSARQGVLQVRHRAVRRKEKLLCQYWKLFVRGGMPRPSRPRRCGASSPAAP